MPTKGALATANTTQARTAAGRQLRLATASINKEAAMPRKPVAAMAARSTAKKQASEYRPEKKTPGKAKPALAKKAAPAKAKRPEKSIIPITRETKTTDNRRSAKQAAAESPRAKASRPHDDAAPARKTRQAKAETPTQRPKAKLLRVHSMPANPVRQTVPPIAPPRIEVPLASNAVVVAEPAANTRADVAVSPSDIRIYQIYYHADQMASLDPDFEPYDNIGKSSRLFEFSVFARLAQSKEAGSAKLWGALSWKFRDKAGMTGSELKRAILDNPGYDVYFCNPHARNEALFHNMWLQGETSHPSFMALCAEVFDVAGLPAELLTSLQPSTFFAAANYFVATPTFWKAYITFISRVLVAADKRLSPTTRTILYSPTADQYGVHGEATYIPFLVERLFSVFLATEGRQFTACKIPGHTQGKEDNVHVKLLSEMKDVACRTKSKWMAACWINYRNLYLSTANGEAWAKKHIKQITPVEIRFASEWSPAVTGAAKR